MLRALVVLLLLANLAALVWTQGWVGKPAPDAHMAQQLEPQRLQLLNAQRATRLQQRSCVELGPLDGEEALRQARQALQRNGISLAVWQPQMQEQGGVWAVATIRMPSKDFQARKEETYRRMRLPFEPLTVLPDEQPSLLLSRHPSQAAAQAALDALEQRSFKGLRVLQLEAPQRRYFLRAQTLDGLQFEKLRALPASTWGSALVSACSAPAPQAASAASAPALAASAPASGAVR